MVNTFLVNSDFTKSAACLDVKRLGKQRVEAAQILRLLEDISVISNIFRYYRPVDPYKWRNWLRELANLYKQSGWYFCWYQGQLRKVSRINTNPKIFKANPELRFIRAVGFYYHPAVLMWLGYEDALKEYLDAHIDRWVSLGYQNTMRRYGVTSAARPIWTYDQYFLERHQASLVRKAPVHYRGLFPEANDNLGYFWPFNQPEKFKRYTVISGTHDSKFITIL